MPRFRWNVQQSWLDTFNPTSIRTMIWPSVKQCFPPTDMLSTRPTAIPAVRSDNLLFVSGQLGARPDGSPEPEFEAQVRRAFANLEATLLAGGCGFDDVVNVTTFHTDPEKQLEIRSWP